MKTKKILFLLPLIFFSTSLTVSAKQLAPPTPSGVALKNSVDTLSVSTINSGSLTPSSPSHNVAGSASGAIVSQTHSAVCGGVTYTSGQNGVTVNQGGGIYSISVTNLTLFAKKNPAMAKLIAHSQLITSPSGSFFNVNPTRNNRCEFTAPESTVKKYLMVPHHSDNHITYSITLLKGFNSHNQPVPNANSVMYGKYTNNASNTTNQYCSSNANNVVTFNNTLNGITLSKINNHEWYLNNAMQLTGNQSINITFLCAGVYMVNSFVNDKYASSVNHTVYASQITAQNPPSPSPPSPSSNPATIKGGTPLGGDVVIIH